jgi:hypothetical protein
MPEKQTLERARKAKRKGKSASTQAGEFVREEMHHIREGRHGARSTKQAIAIAGRKHVAPALVFHHQKKVRFPRRLGAAPSVPTRRGRDGRPSHLAAVQKPPSSR